MLPASVPIVWDLTLPQILFGGALAGAASIIGIFSLYVISSSIWGNRWFRKRDRD